MSTDSNWEATVRKALWLRVQEEWKQAREESDEELQAIEGPVTKRCRDCQRDLPIHRFHWAQPDYEPDTAHPRDVHSVLTEYARKLGLIESDEFVYATFYLSNDNGKTIHCGLGGTPTKAKRKLTNIARGRG